MFDNLGTASVQAVGFFGIFGFFVYQLLSDGKKTNNTLINSPNRQVNALKDLNDVPNKKGLFVRKIEPIKGEAKPRKKGLFGKKVQPIKEKAESKKKGWFN